MHDTTALQPAVTVDSLQPDGSAHGASDRMILGTIARISATASGRLREEPTLTPKPAEPLGAEPAALPAFVKRFYLQAAARELLAGERVAHCLRALIPGRLVEVCYAAAVQRAHYAGLQVCASVWMCPVCAAKISERRRIDLHAGVTTWRGRGNMVLMASFTLSHKLGDDLVAVKALIKRAYTLFRSGMYWTKIANAIALAGSVRSLEVTFSYDNGWHPHFHVLFFLDTPLDEHSMDGILFFSALSEQFKARWVACVERAGGWATHEHGLHLTYADNEIAEYIAKWGHEPTEPMWTAAHELTKAVSKRGRTGGRTPLQLLADFAENHEADAGRLYVVYARAFKGERQLWWSQGLRALLGLDVEQTDQEVAEERILDAVILASLTLRHWRIILANDVRADLLLVASSGDVALLRSWLADFHIFV